MWHLKNSESAAPESCRLSVIHLPTPSKENWRATTRMGLDAEQAKTTSVSHNLLLVLEQQLHIWWMEMLNFGHSWDPASHLLLHHSSLFSCHWESWLLSKREDWLYTLLPCPPAWSWLQLIFKQLRKESISPVCIHSVNSVWLIKCLLNNNAILAITFMGCA